MYKMGANLFSVKHVKGNQTLLLRKVVSLKEFLSQDTAMNYKYDKLMV